MTFKATATVLGSAYTRSGTPAGDRRAIPVRIPFGPYTRSSARDRAPGSNKNYSGMIIGNATGYGVAYSMSDEEIRDKLGQKVQRIVDFEIKVTGVDFEERLERVRRKLPFVS